MLWSPIIGSTFQQTSFLSLSLQDIWITAYAKEGFPDSSVGKESTSNAGDLGSIPGLERSPGEGIGYQLQYSWAALVAQLVKNLPGGLGLIPGLGRSPGEGKGYPLQYSGLENSVDYTDHGVAKSWTWLSDFHFTQKKDLPFFFFNSLSFKVFEFVIILLLFYVLVFGHEAHWVLAPQSGMKPTPHAWEGKVLTIGPTEKSERLVFLKKTLLNLNSVVITSIFKC